MPSNCAVATCGSWAKGTKKREDLGLYFFRFPKDPATRTAWVHRCARKDVLNPDTAAVCSLHFTSDDYDPSYLVKRSLMPNVKPLLKPKAVPSQNIPSHPARLVLANSGYYPDFKSLKSFSVVFYFEYPPPYEFLSYARGPFVKLSTVKSFCHQQLLQ